MSDDAELARLRQLVELQRAALHRWKTAHPHEEHPGACRVDLVRRLEVALIEVDSFLHDLRLCRDRDEAWHIVGDDVRLVALHERVRAAIREGR